MYRERVGTLCRYMATLATIRRTQPLPPRRVLRVDAHGRWLEPTFDDLVRGALAGEQDAWNELVARLQRVAWRAIGGFDLTAEDRKDAFAGTFFRLYERLGTIREPAKLPGWVATTARHEVLALLRARRRDTPVDLDDQHLPPVDADPGARLLDLELHEALQRGLARLSDSCRQLLQLLTIDPPLSYAEVGDLLDIPHGSIGPTRQRCLDRLRATPELNPFLQEAPR
jgi:RNA polymerase sigma factor (sigma-70 family)